MQSKFDFLTYSTFKNKVKFMQMYSTYLNRDWCLLDTPSSISAFHDFLSSHGCVIVKPTSGHCGQGVRCVRLEDTDIISEIINRIKKGEVFICEEKIENVYSLKKINPTSLDTLRVNTFIDKHGVVHFLDFVLRVGGKGAVIDNLNGGGVAYHVHPDWGIVDLPGKDS